MSDPAFHLPASGPRPVAPFSHAVDSDGWAMLSGQMPTDPDAPDAPLPEGVAARTRRVMDNLTIAPGGLGRDPIPGGRAVTAGGRAPHPVADAVFARAAGVLEDPVNRARWVRHAGANT